MNKLLLILLFQTADAESSSKVPELLAPILSGLAFILSASAFIFSAFIQTKERRRNLRQTLSTALSDIARINVAVAELKKTEKDNIPETLPIRKSYNSQLGTLASVADFLIKENKQLVTDADCELMALTYDDLGEVDRSKEYWEQAIQLAPNERQKSRYRGAYAACMFRNNEDEEARKLFSETTNSAPAESDRDLSELCHVYLAWANLEVDFGNDAKYAELQQKAKEHCKKIRNRGKREAMSKLIGKADE